MCFFPTPTPPNSIARKKGVTEFGCGVCPECLRKKANYWALKCSAQAKTMNGMMITLTYDQYLHDSFGNIVGERLPEDMSVHKRDAQLFIKRLRKYIDLHGHGEKIKYLLSAEYGNRTHRPHYHVIIFGYQFPDIVPYKKSKRGNMIYRSHTLDMVWKNGICTVDSINITGSVARYCTKYAMKDAGADDTFMLFSRGIGDEELLRDFNGRSYFVDGKEFPIPRLIWLKWLERQFDHDTLNATHIYIRGDVENYKARQRLYGFRDFHPRYQAYLAYWKSKVDTFEQPPVFQRILSLDNSKYFAYKQACLKVLNIRSMDGLGNFPAPRSSRITSFFRDLFNRYGYMHIVDADTGEARLTFPRRHFFLTRKPKLTFAGYCTRFNNPFGVVYARKTYQLRLSI